MSVPIVVAVSFVPNPFSPKCEVRATYSDGRERLAVWSRKRSLAMIARLGRTCRLSFPSSSGEVLVSRR